MKLHFFLFGLLLLSACNDDDAVGPDNLTDDILNYDGDNVTSPQLGPGVYELAARFTAEELDPVRDKRLTGVRFFMGPRPATLKVLVSGPGTATEPGNILFEFDLTNVSDIQEGAFNELQLPSPLVLPDEMWLSVEFEMDQTGQNIGCDGGPADPNGDFIFDSNLGQWQTFRERTGESVNWNIRGILE